jgi:hypothetical protein
MKTCTKCFIEKPVDNFYTAKNVKSGRYGKCKVCHDKVTNEWRINNPQAYAKMNRVRNIRYHQKHRPERLQKQKLYYQGLKDRAYQAYGGYRCACCGETEKAFLCLDHLLNNGNKHRRIIQPGRLYFWLQTEDYPPIFQVLCANCNQGKHANGGTCPHRTNKFLESIAA